MNHRNYAPQAKVIRDALSAQAAAETIESDAERRQVIDAITAMPEQRHIIGEDQPLSRKANLDTNVFRKVRDVVGQDGDGNFKLQRFRTLYQQMMLPVVLRETLPTGLLGLLSLLMIMLVLSTDDSRIFMLPLPFCRTSSCRFARSLSRPGSICCGCGSVPSESRDFF